MADDGNKEEDERPEASLRAQQDASSSRSDYIPEMSTIQEFDTSSTEKEANDTVRISARTSSQAGNPNSSDAESTREPDVTTPPSAKTPAYRDEMREGMVSHRGSDNGDDTVRVCSISDLSLPRRNIVMTALHYRQYERAGR